MGTTARQVVALAVIVLIVMLAAGLGGLFTGRSVSTWYRTLSRPDWTPPDRLFGPVWTVLYLAMAVAAWMVWRRGTPATTAAMAAFAVQLALNAAWSGLFFGLRSPAAGMADIVLLWLAIVATIALFLRVSIPAGLIMLPYLAWVTFAAALNFAIWRMN
jgi:tryptophan-rich sensory protein